VNSISKREGVLPKWGNSVKRGLYYWLGFDSGKRNIEKLAERSRQLAIFSRQKAVCSEQLGIEIFIPEGNVGEWCILCYKDLTPTVLENEFYTPADKV